MKKFSLILIIISAVIGTTAFAASTVFTDDTTFATWFSSSAIKMKSLGIMNGYADGTFGPSKPVTRAELAVMLDRFKTNVVDKTQKEKTTEPAVCTEEARAGLVIFLRDTAGKLISGASFYINGSKEKDIEFWEDDNGKYSGISEGNGYYTVEISKEGYLNHIETIKLEQDACHVILQTRTITLVPVAK